MACISDEQSEDPDRYSYQNGWGSMARRRKRMIVLLGLIR